MTCLRLLIDDVPACFTQRAVLADFAATLAAGVPGTGSLGGAGSVGDAGLRLEVVWTSALRGLPSWPDVAPESSRCLAVRLAALAPLEDTLTVFLPAHTLVGRVDLLAASRWRPPHGLSSEGPHAVADLDLFVVDNASASAAALHAHMQRHTGYEAASRHEAVEVGPLPVWLVGGGLRSARLFTQRPWYSAHAARRRPWLDAVARALDAGRLTQAMVADDVQQARVRPSLWEEVAALRGAGLHAGGPDLTLDALFVPPERRLPPAQRALLHSRELQRRTLAHARRNLDRKDRRAEGLRAHVRRYLRPFLRRLRQGWRTTWRFGWRAGLRLLHPAYAATLRPLVHRLRAPGGAGP